MRSITYLIISLLLFAPFLPLAISLAKKLLSHSKKHYWLGSICLIMLSICMFYIVSNALMYLFGYYEAWITEKYARSYLGREAIWHAIAILLCVVYARFNSKLPSSSNSLLITASQGRSKTTVLASAVLWIEADDHYLKIHTNELTLLKRETLDNMSKKLAPNFVRIHRKYLINQQEISRFEKEKRADFVVLTNGERLKIGRSFANQPQLLHLHDI